MRTYRELVGKYSEVPRKGGEIDEDVLVWSGSASGISGPLIYGTRKDRGEN